MTVTNTAATVARSSEPGATAPTLDLALDSSFRGWLESSASEGEKWLRSSAQDGDLYAMEKLGLRLLTGDGLPKSLEEGVGWLKKSAELGSPFSMEKLAEYELDENEAPNSSAE